MSNELMPKHELAVTQGAPLMMETQSLEQAKEQFRRLQLFIKSQMIKSLDYGIIPGSKKPSLWKPGAEKLLNFHGLGCRMETTPETVLDWKNGFFNYAYRATVFNTRTGAVIATADGSCNSMEAKYRYVWLSESKVPRGTDKKTLETKEIRGKDGKPWTLYRVDNTDPYSLVNTLQKMAAKRALVAAVLIACRASDIFTTEIEEDELPETAPASAPTAATSSSETPVTSTGEVSSAAQAAGKGGKLVSEAQLKRLYAIRKAHGVDEGFVSAFIGETFPYTADTDGNVHPSKLTMKDYDRVIKFVETGE